MNRESIIKLLYSIYSSIDTREERNWEVVQDTILYLISRLQVVGNPYEFAENVNCKYYESLENFTELFNECFE